MFAARVTETEKAIRAAEQEIVRLEERIAGDRMRLQEAEAKRVDALTLSERAEDLRWLQQAFGPRGVQPAIIDEYLPALDSLTDSVLDRMTGGRLRLRWTTQGATAAGDVRERLDLRVFDSRTMRDRDAATCSGGETQLIQAANRVGLALWASQITGQRFDTLVIDEAGNNTDDEATEAFIAAMQEAAAHFSLLLLVTPKARVAQLLPRRIELSPRWDGVDANLVGVA